MVYLLYLNTKVVLPLNWAKKQILPHSLWRHFIYTKWTLKSQESVEIFQSLSLTETKSKGVCPSWFLRVGSAPWANNKAQSCVRPFWAASCKGVKAHLSVALTHALYLISKAATSTCCKRKHSCYTLKYYFITVGLYEETSYTPIFPYIHTYSGNEEKSCFSLAS